MQISIDLVTITHSMRPMLKLMLITMGLSAFVLTVTFFTTGRELNRRLIAGLLGFGFAFIIGLAVYLKTAYHEAWWWAMVTPAYVAAVTVKFLYDTRKHNLL